MARDLTTAMETAVAGATVYPILLMEGNFDSGPLRLWTGLGDLTWDAKTWTGSGEVVHLSKISETDALRADGLVITYRGVDDAIIDLVEAEDYQGRDVTVWLGTLDAAGAVIADPYQIFKGFADVMTDESDGSAVKVMLAAENNLIALERAKVRNYTDEDQRAEYAGDLFFEFVADLQEREIRGK